MKDQGGQRNQDVSFVGMMPDSIRYALQNDVILNKTQQFSAQIGRRPRILVCYIGASGPRRNLNQIASIFAQWGFDVDIGPARQSIQHAAVMAVENDVHVVCVLCKTEHYPLTVVELAQALKKQQCGHIMVMIAGNIPAEIQQASTPEGLNLIHFNPKTTGEVVALLERLS